MPTRESYRASVRRLVRDTPPTDTLASALTDAATSVVVTLGIFSGDPQVIQVGSELIFCAEYDRATKTYTNCIRGYMGTTAAAHDAGDQVQLQPRWSDTDVNDAINAALRRMSALGLYRIRTVELTYNPAIDGYNLATDAEDVYEVRAKEPGATKSWGEIVAYDVLHDMPTADFASGIAIMLRQPGWSGQTIRVRYSARYGLFTDDSTDSTADSIGLPDYLADIPVLGAAAELMATAEVGRTQVESAEESARAADVQGGLMNQTARVLDRRFQDRVAEGLRVLRRTNPVRLRYRS